jgi:uncharacterized protein YoxC
MIHEIAIWYLLSTGIIVPIIVAYILSVVMRMSKQYDNYNSALHSHERQLVALTEDYRHVYTMAHDASNETENCVGEIASLHEAVSEHNQAFTDFREEIDRLDGKIDNVGKEHINNLFATNEAIASHTKQINKLFAKYREIETIAQTPPPELKVEPTIQESIAQWRPIGNEICSSLYIEGTLFSTLIDYSRIISETIQTINKRPHMLINNKSYDWIITGGDMFGEFAEQMSVLVNADVARIVGIEHFFDKPRDVIQQHQQFNTPSAQYHLAIVNSATLQSASTSVFGTQLPVESANTIRQFYDHQGVRGAGFSANWYVLVVEVYAANQVRIKHLPCRTRQIARRVFSFYCTFMRKAAEAHNELGYETRRRSFPITSLRPFTEIKYLTLDTSVLDKLKETFV